MVAVLYKSLWKRILIALITGILAYFVIEVIFNVRFRYYDLFSKPDVCCPIHDGACAPGPGVVPSSVVSDDTGSPGGIADHG